MKRIHNLASLKADIQYNADETRTLRDKARQTSGLERHGLKEEAKGYAPETRAMLLAYGYLRGKTIEQMESEYTHPDNLPDYGDILAEASPVFMRGPDAEEWQDEREVIPPDDRGLIGKVLGKPAPKPKIEHLRHPGWEAFSNFVKADIKKWHARVLMNHATYEAEKRKGVA